MHVCKAKVPKMCLTYLRSPKGAITAQKTAKVRQNTLRTTTVPTLQKCPVILRLVFQPPVKNAENFVILYFFFKKFFL